MNNKNAIANNLSKYPNPPNHYLKFTSDNSLQPPSLDYLSKISSFMTFGKEYKIREINHNKMN